MFGLHITFALVLCALSESAIEWKVSDCFPNCALFMHRTTLRVTHSGFVVRYFQDLYVSQYMKLTSIYNFMIQEECYKIPVSRTVKVKCDLRNT